MDDKNIVRIDTYKVIRTRDNDVSSEIKVWDNQDSGEWMVETIPDKNLDVLKYLKDNENDMDCSIVCILDRIVTNKGDILIRDNKYIWEQIKHILISPEKEVKFECECGNEKMEEIVGNVTQTSVIELLTDDGLNAHIDYNSNILTEGGEIDRYQCSKCGRRIGDNIMSCTTPEELIEWLKNNCCQD